MDHYSGSSAGQQNDGAKTVREMTRLERMELEQKDLCGKLARLDDFLIGRSNEASSDELPLLFRQQRVMRDYSNVLQQRILYARKFQNAAMKVQKGFVDPAQPGWAEANGRAAQARKTDVAGRDRTMRDALSPAEADAAERESLACRVEDIESRLRVLSQRLEQLRCAVIPEGENYGGEPLVNEIQKMRGWARSVNESTLITAQKFGDLQAAINEVRELNAQTAARVTAAEEAMQSLSDQTGRALAGIHKRMDARRADPLGVTVPGGQLPSSLS